ncbi:hypothetical protein AB0G02_26735 [Actinosynnema sp. NPDC023658]|uniref:hypothetical protein n=1 Tax=Actinosynnema sp. NPDC023658 TaxID=3155465 RepID=UPI0033D8A93C
MDEKHESDALDEPPSDWTDVLPGVWVAKLPSSNGYRYSLDGDTLTVENALTTRVYSDLTGDGDDCFPTDYTGHTVELCRYHGG